MKVSVIVPTYNGAHKLPNILQALEKQTYQDFETLVVVDGSTDHTVELLEKSNFDLQELKFVIQTNRGRAAVRNRGAKEAKGDLLIFFDDDMRPLPICVEKHVKHHESNLDTILVGGSLEDKNKCTKDIQRFRYHLSVRWSGGLDKCILRFPFLTAQNFSIGKKLFYKLGKFDERLKDTEDYDLAVKAFNVDVPIYVDSTIQAYHDDYISCRSYILRQRQYKKAYDHLLKLKPELHLPFDRRKLGVTKGWKKVVISLFASGFWVKAIDQEKFWIRYLPRYIRYKIYDLVITALGKVFIDKPI